MRRFKDLDDASENLNDSNIGEIVRFDVNQKVDFQFSIQWKRVEKYRIAKLKTFTPVPRT